MIDRRLLCVMRGALTCGPSAGSHEELLPDVLFPISGLHTSRVGCEQTTRMTGPGSRVPLGSTFPRLILSARLSVTHRMEVQYPGSCFT